MKDDIKALNIQLYTLIFSLISILISIILTLNEKQVIQNKKTFFTKKQSYDITLFNRTLILIIALIFLYINYKESKSDDQPKSNKRKLRLQIDASILTIIAAIISLYVVYNSKPESIVSTENPII